MIEEEIFYPACEGKVEEADLKEAYVEHDGAKVLIAGDREGRTVGRILRREGQGASIGTGPLPTPELATLETTTI